MVLKTVTFYFIYCLFIQGEVAEMQNLRRSSNLSFCSGIFLSWWQDDGQCWDTSWHVVERFLRLLSGFCWCHWNSVFPWIFVWWRFLHGLLGECTCPPNPTAMQHCCLELKGNLDNQTLCISEMFCHHFCVFVYRCNHCMQYSVHIFCSLWS